MKFLKILKNKVIKFLLRFFNKQEKKDLKKRTKNFVSNPGQKLGIIKENIETEINPKLSKIPEKIKYKNSFSKQYGLINYKYKKGM
jgi:hypothetical protein